MKRTRDDRRAGPYRSRRGAFLGVCRGLAEYYNLSTFWVRMGVVALFLVTGFWPTALFYVVAALLMRKEPVVTFINDSDREFYESYAHSRTLALSRLHRTYQRLDRRIQQMENIVTSNDFDWDRRLRES